VLTLIDAHTHIQSSRAATRAQMARLGLPTYREGATKKFLGEIDRSGVEWTMIVGWLPAQLMVARAAAAGVDRDEAAAEALPRWHELNAWAVATAAVPPDRLKAIASLDPCCCAPDSCTRRPTASWPLGPAG
jgi:predicted TIM-barrel fold metal-dependent hydrolase